MAAKEQRQVIPVLEHAIHQRELLGLVISLGEACDRAMDDDDTARLLMLLDERKVVLGRIAELAVAIAQAGPTADKATQEELDAIDAAIDRIGHDDLARFTRMNERREHYASQMKGAAHAGRAAAAYGLAATPVSARAEDRCA